MIVCSCNALSERDVKSAIKAGASRPTQVYAHSQCSAQCGRCASHICKLLKARENAQSPAHRAT
ncbi:hypothetical protein E3E12_04490 [Formicincola oecophyllae]|uniref:Bacterioferritin-associated ferredoxin n=1 Tax=Formicincola oecophyllae TaxID=2558361 RepID=A0A4Y6UBT7_9PROT|nr:hypothetical protein E3E12_04490 [Formicincola oecophyllae]